MISLLLPTRKRPENLKRFVESALNTANREVEIVCYVDDDDDSYDNLNLPIIIIKGPRILMADMWNKCAKKATGKIFGLMGDDVIFRTKDWDKYIRQVFSKYPDKIIFAHGNDGTEKGENFGTLGFIHRNWYDAVGYAMAPYFSSDMCDTWLNDVANELDRRVYIPEVLTEHMHYAFGKSEFDDTYKERVERGARDNVGELYYSTEMARKRTRDARKLKKAMA